MAETDDVMRELDDAAEQVAAGTDPEASGPEALVTSQEHLDEAWLLAAAINELPPGTGLRSVRKAALTVTRPVTSQQVPFNQRIVSAVDQLLKAARSMAHDLETTTERSDSGQRRLQAAVATSDLAIEDLTSAVERLGAVCEDLSDRLGSAEQELAEARTELRSLRARHDVVLRAAREAVDRVGGGPTDRIEPAALAPLERALADDEAELAAQLRTAVLGDRATRLQAAGGPAGAFDVLADDAVVVDLAAGAGELVEVLRQRGRSARGVEANPVLAAEAQHHGQDVTTGDPLSFLAEAEPGSVDGLAALGLPERLDGERLVALLDGALEALRPGGLLVLGVTDPSGPAAADGTLWADPALRRPVAPDLLEVLVLARGFAEAEQQGRPGAQVRVVARKAGTGA